MENKSSPIVINELRENLAEYPRRIFRKSLLGGYNSKEVQEHIKFMNDRLKQAEVSYINRLDECNATITMLSQERDKLKEQLNQAQTAMKELGKKADSLYIENKELMHERKDLEALASKAGEYLTQCEALRLENDGLNKKCASYLDSNKQLQEELSKAKEEKDHFSMTAGADETSKAPDEYAQLKKQCEEAIKEKNNAIAEKNIALEKYKMTSADLDAMYARNRELWNENSRLKLRIRKVIRAYETNAHEIASMHMKNMNELRACINTVLDLLDKEGEDIIKLSRGTSIGLEPEDEIFLKKKG